MAEQLRFVEDFATPTMEEWTSEVEKALKGAPFDKKMLTRTYEGFTLRPVYTRKDWPADGDPSGMPGAMPFTRGGRAAGNRVSGWDVRQRYTYPDPAKCNDIILNELARGVSSVLIQFDSAGRAGLDADAPEAGDHVGENGVAVYSVDDLDRLLTGVYLDLASVHLNAGGQFLTAAGLLMALWRRRRVPPEKALGAFNADPLSALAGSGRLSQSIDRALEDMALLAKHTAATYPNVTAVSVDTQVYHGAGATESQDLGIAMATGLAYLKAMVAAGMDIDTACRQITFTFAIDCDQFLGICKLRAARKLWARVAESCGASAPARAMSVHAVSAMRMMAKRDPWVNILRTSVSGFAAAVGGADAITVLPFETTTGEPTELGRRVARNIHVVLAEESNLSKVIDAGGGSWYIETRTDELARAAWAEFQDIEKAGGVVSALSDGSLAKRIAQAYAQREANLAKRRDPITGVSEFPNVNEPDVENADIDPAAVRALAAERVATARSQAGDGVTRALETLKSTNAGNRVVGVAATAEAGGTIGAMAAVLSDTATTIDPLPRHRLAEAFEALRAASDAHKASTGSRPKIFLANLGPIAKHTARSTFAKNFFEVAGIEAVTNDGFSAADACADACAESGAKIAILCSADPIYEQMAADVAAALKKAGCQFVYMAGHPGDKRDAYTQAGVDDFVFLGGDILKTTSSALSLLGVTAQ